MKSSLNRISKLGTVGLLALFLTVSCGKDDTIVQTGPEASITDINVLASAPDRTTLVGKKVDLSGATVQTVVGTYVFWAGDPHTAIPVVREDRMNGNVTEHVRAGERVRVTGVVRLLETVPSTDKLWDKITDQERRDILSSRVYIAADKVTIIK